MKSTSHVQKAHHLDLASARILDGLLGGRYRSVFRGPGLEFSEVRAYQEGDDVRLMDWNVSSRFNEPYIKTFREERELNLFLVLDVSSSMFTGAGEESLTSIGDTIFSLFALAAVQNNDRVGVCLFSDTIEFWAGPAKGRAHALLLMNKVASHKPSGRGSDLAMALRRSAESLHKRGIVIILSDFKTSGYQRELRILSSRHDVIAIRLVSAEDIDFPNLGLFFMEDPETGISAPAFSGSDTFRRSYREYWSHERKKWFNECKRYGAWAMELSTDDDPVVRISQFFRRRQKQRGQR